MKELKTTDGGKNWISVNSSYLIGESAKDVFYQISFPNASTGYFYGFITNKLYKTTDGGFTWTGVNLPTISYDVSVVLFYENNLGLILC